jgi:hypothetical protein
VFEEISARGLWEILFPFSVLGTLQFAQTGIQVRLTRHFISWQKNTNFTLTLTWSDTEKTRLCLYLLLFNKWRKSTRISLKIVPFWVDTQLHTMLPTLKAILQITFWKTVEDLRRFVFTSSTDKKMGSFEHRLDFWEEVEVAGSQVWWMGWVLKHSDVIS